MTRAYLKCQWCDDRFNNVARRHEHVQQMIMDGDKDHIGPYVQAIQKKQEMAKRKWLRK